MHELASCFFLDKMGNSKLCTGPDLLTFSEEFQGSNLSSEVQLLIPAYQFNFLGGVVEWTAQVRLQQNVLGNMEFQVLKPVTSPGDSVYEVIYHNDYRMENINGTVVNLALEEAENSIIPVDVSDGVGLYTKVVCQPLELLFESAPNGGGVDVYYREGLSQRRCVLHL